jgi:hypothetical protein
MWDDSLSVYNFWHDTFGRHSWDGADDWVFTAVGCDQSMPGHAVAKDTNGDTIFDVVQANIKTGEAGPQLDGHELGHALWHGTADPTGTGPGSFWHQSGSVNEHLADVNGWRYRGSELLHPYDCDEADSRHYTQLMTLDPSQLNKFIGNCNGWLMHQHQVDQDPGTGGYQYTHYGVTVTSTIARWYDNTWYKALSTYMDPSFDYFDWWQFQVQAAYDLYGFGSPYYAALYARDAIGSWTAFSKIASVNVRSGDRIGAASWVGASKGPCIFYRRPSSTAQIYYACYWPPNPPAPWITGLFNNVSVDPAASEPYATYGYFWYKDVIWVFWRGTDNRIRFRLLDVDTMTISDPYDLGSQMLTSSVPAAAPIQQPDGYDRIVVVFHPLSHPTYFYWTYIGDPDPDGADMGAAFDSDVPPSLVSYPHPNRIYFLRANFNTGSYPRHILYASYTVSGGWTTPSNTTTNLTALYNADGHVLTDIVRTDKGLALAEYSRSGAKRLNFFFVTYRSPQELWHGSLAESSPGVLSTGGYRAVPQDALGGSTSQAAGGLAPSTGGTMLWHFWMPSSSFLSFWRKYSN